MIFWHVLHLQEEGTQSAPVSAEEGREGFDAEVGHQMRSLRQGRSSASKLLDEASGEEAGLEEVPRSQEGRQRKREC
jgi:hypothetical protein